ncbi:MAG: 4Fe-4S dicluster domain-containing protein [Pirellulales bacterium]|nr:4Fe-4S dicluster domain-containing protein [Pirellulales bacterium]
MAHAETDDLAEAIADPGTRPRIYLESAEGLAVPLQCRHCEDAPCVAVCPSGALSRSSEAEPVLADQQKCIGCAYCVQACPFGVIRVATDQTVVIKCDLCIGRQGQGLPPACVAACPVGALWLEEMDEVAKRSRAKAAAGAAAASLTNEGR